MLCLIGWLEWLKGKSSFAAQYFKLALEDVAQCVSGRELVTGLLPGLREHPSEREKASEGTQKQGNQEVKLVAFHQVSVRCQVVSQEVPGLRIQEQGKGRCAAHELSHVQPHTADERYQNGNQRYGCNNPNTIPTEAAAAKHVHTGCGCGCHKTDDRRHKAHVPQDQPKDDAGRNGDKRKQSSADDVFPGWLGGGRHDPAWNDSLLVLPIALETGSLRVLQTEGVFSCSRVLRQPFSILGAWRSVTGFLVGLVDSKSARSCMDPPYFRCCLNKFRLLFHAIWDLATGSRERT